MDEGTAGEGKEWLGRLAFGVGDAIEAVLVDRVTDALREIGLQLGRGDGDAVEDEDQVEAILVVRRITDLADDAEPIGVVAGDDVGVHRQSGFELGETQLLLHAQDVDPVAEDVQRPGSVERIPQPLEQCRPGRGTVILRQRLPGLRLRLLDPGEHIRRKEGKLPVVGLRFTAVVQPAIGSQLLADLVFQLDLFVEAHAVIRSGQSVGCWVSWAAGLFCRGVRRTTGYLETS